MHMEAGHVEVDVARLNCDQSGKTYKTLLGKVRITTCCLEKIMTCLPCSFNSPRSHFI